MAMLEQIDATALQRVPELEAVAVSSSPKNQGPYEKVKVFERSFSLPWEEFQGMSKDEVIGNYLRTAVDQTVSRIKAARYNLGRLLNFRRFPVPDNSLNRKYFVYDSGGVFFAVMASRAAHAIGKTANPGIERIAQVVEFSVKAVVALEEGENL